MTGKLQTYPCTVAIFGFINKFGVVISHSKTAALPQKQPDKSGINILLAELAKKNSRRMKTEDKTNRIVVC